MPVNAEHRAALEIDQEKLQVAFQRERAAQETWWHRWNTYCRRRPMSVTNQEMAEWGAIGKEWQAASDDIRKLLRIDEIVNNPITR